MTTRFQTLANRLLVFEGGLVDDPNDPGGLTNHGVSIRFLADLHNKPVDDPELRQTLRNMTVTRAQVLFETVFWRATNINMLPVGIDWSVFDMAINAGPVRAIKLLQQSMNTFFVDGYSLVEDGIIGSLTESEVIGFDQKSLIEEYAVKRLYFYNNLVTFPIFGKGWTTRTHQCRNQSLLDLALAQSVNDKHVQQSKEVDMNPVTDEFERYAADRVKETADDALDVLEELVKTIKRAWLRNSATFGLRMVRRAFSVPDDINGDLD